MYVLAVGMLGTFEGLVILKALASSLNSVTALAGGVVVNARLLVTSAALGIMSKLSITMARSFSFAVSKEGAVTPGGIFTAKGANGSSCGKTRIFSLSWLPSHSCGNGIMVNLVGETDLN